MSRSLRAFGFALCAVLFALCQAALAQQPKKVPRLGFLALSPLPLSRIASRHFGRDYARLGTWREKTL